MIEEEKELLEAKEHIISISRELQEIGLLVRTWGNISCRIDDEYFLITPSGIRYEDLTPEKIVRVKISDLSYEGDVLPSSESRVHAACYKVRKDCNFIIHTHQVYASCVGTLGLKKVYTYFEDEDVVVPVAAYALPGTDKLAENVEHTLKKYKDSNAIIMANHGTVCLGESSREALYEAEKLEVSCNNFLIDVCKTDMHHGVEEGYNSHIDDGKIVYDTTDTPERVKRIHERIYAKRPDVKYIIHNKSQAVMTVSRRSNHMRPLLDDFAQLIGCSIKIPGDVHIKRNVNAYFSLNDGAYCVGATYDDAVAASIVLDKGCIAHIAVMRHGEGHYLSTWECHKMNMHYRRTYSKLAEE